MARGDKGYDKKKAKTAARIVKFDTAQAKKAEKKARRPIGRLKAAASDKVDARDAKVHRRHHKVNNEPPPGWRP
jgi:hypothetical protein